ncbi:hypothetical protein [Paenibacillus glacialis]|uniref:Uncharacterized protein n=1 Tax=Paenibacillus glacialis TaxID=494026 RepID=A0A162Q1Z9_9BACL|nr:hypothetical protein [Paenibacillus glacialis]OAB41450.1 hypothetical protein PGLA_16760 [Paenibacillus glacialis]
MFSTNASLQDSIILDNKEFFFLAGILGSDHLLGVEDPFEGRLAEEITDEWHKTKTLLLEKGYLIRDKNEIQLSITPLVFSRVAIACLAERACWIKYSICDEIHESYLHVSNERVVRVCKTNDLTACYMLDDLGTIEEACCRIMGEIDMQDGSHSDLPALFFSQQHFNELYEKSHVLDVDALSNKFAEVTDDLEGSISLAKSLKFLSGEGEFYLSKWTGLTWETQQAAFLMNGSVNWLVRRSIKSDQDWLVASPTCKEKFQNMLLMWLKQSSQSDVR